jgi:DNA polymerase-4
MGKQDGRDRHVTSATADDSQATILHVDMDAFFASVELLDHPELVGKPVIVGHNSSRSIVTAATYEARKFGVNSALPMSIALRRCPQAIVLEPHFERYRHYSRVVMAILDGVTPKVERLGIDEAFLDVAGAQSVFGSPIRVAELIRARVRAETGLICSVGAASTKFVAKLASGLSKPDGLLVVPHDETLAFLHPLPISKLWGVGGTTEETLRGRGFATIGDLARASVDTLTDILGPAAAQRLHDLAWGIDPRAVHEGDAEKSIGHELTFETDESDPTVVRRELLRLSTMVAARLRDGGFSARTIALKLRFADFTTLSRSRTLSEPTDLGRRIYEEARELFDLVSRESVASTRADRAHTPIAPIRLIGVRAERLIDVADVQLGLWDDEAGWREAEETMDAATARFGRGALTPARLIGHEHRARPTLGQRD